MGMLAVKRAMMAKVIAIIVSLCIAISNPDSLYYAVCQAIQHVLAI